MLEYAETLARDKQYEKAIDTLGNMIREEPTFSLSYLSLSTLYEKTGQLDKAIQLTDIFRKKNMEKGLKEGYVILADKRGLFVNNKIQTLKNGRTSNLSSWDSGYGKCTAFIDSFSGTGNLGYEDKKHKLEAAYNRPLLNQPLYVFERS